MPSQPNHIDRTVTEAVGERTGPAKLDRRQPLKPNPSLRDVKEGDGSDEAKSPDVAVVMAGDGHEDDHELFVEKPSVLRMHKIVFAVICLMELFVNFDSGVLSASMAEVGTPAEQGLIGSSVFVGLSMSCPFYARLFTKIRSQRKVLLVCIMANALAVLWFGLATEFWGYIISRTLIGVSQGGMVIYAPCWVNEFAPHSLQTVWLSIMQVFCTLGVVVGYGCAGFLPHIAGTPGWRFSLYVQAVFLGIIAICFVVIRGRHINSQGGAKGRLEARRLGKLKERWWKKVRLQKANRAGGATDMAKALGRGMKMGSETDVAAVADSFEAEAALTRAPPSPKPAVKRLTVLDPAISADADTPVPASEGAPMTTQLTFLQQIMLLWRCKVFVHMTLALSFLYFVVTGVQYWITDYLQFVMGESKDMVVATFSVTAITGPVVGVVFGGWLVDRLGGFEDETGAAALRSIAICVGFGVAAFICSFGAAFFTGYWACVVSVWFLLFFGGALLAPATGICITAVPYEVRPISSGMSMLTFNIIGYAAAPFICGLVAEADPSRAWGFRVAVLASTVALVFCVSALYAAKHVVDANTKALELAADADVGDAMAQDSTKLLLSEEADVDQVIGAAGTGLTGAGSGSGTGEKGKAGEGQQQQDLVLTAAGAQKAKPSRSITGGTGDTVTVEAPTRDDRAGSSFASPLKIRTAKKVNFAGGDGDGGGGSPMGPGAKLAKLREKRLRDRARTLGFRSRWDNVRARAMRSGSMSLVTLDVVDDAKKIVAVKAGDTTEEAIFRHDIASVAANSGIIALGSVRVSNSHRSVASLGKSTRSLFSSSRNNLILSDGVTRDRRNSLSLVKRGSQLQLQVEEAKRGRPTRAATTSPAKWGVHDKNNDKKNGPKNLNQGDKDLFVAPPPPPGSSSEEKETTPLAAPSQLDVAVLVDAQENGEGNKGVPVDGKK